MPHVVFQHVNAPTLSLLYLKSTRFNKFIVMLNQKLHLIYTPLTCMVVWKCKRILNLRRLNMLFSNHGSQPIRTQVYETLKQYIIELKLSPGQALSENEMATQFQVSRTPIRESFVRLSQEGLVQVIPQKGTFVSLINTGLVDEARFMRMKLELAIVEEACKNFPHSALEELELNLLEQKKYLDLDDVETIFNLDQQFHFILFAGVKKQHIWHTMNILTIHLDRCRRLRLLDNHEWQHLYNEHLFLYESIKNNDSAAAIMMMKTHLSNSIHDIEILKQKYSNYFN